MMEYKRLTVKGVNLEKKHFSGINYSGYTSYEIDEEALDLVIKAINRLAELEDKIEQGTLIEIPKILQDKKGDWRVYFYSERYGLIDCYVYDTREEAEKRLKEIQE